MITKGYEIRVSYEDDFVNLLEGLKKKYPEELFSLQGLGGPQLDINFFSKQFFSKAASKNVAGISADPNSNIGEMNTAQWSFEHSKGISRLNSHYLMWDYLKKTSSEDDANEILEHIINGTIFVNDSQAFEKPYCFGFDLATMCSEGLNFFKGLMKIKAPHRTDSFIDLLIQATAYLSNQIAGATSYPTLFVNLDWYLQNDFGKDYSVKLSIDSLDSLSYKIKNYFQKLIYSWGFPFRGSQSPFVNVSIFDRGFLQSLFGITDSGGLKYTNPDGSAPDLESIYRLQKYFYEYFDSIFGVEGIFTFPVITLAVSILDGITEDGKVELFYSDPDFIDWVCKVYCSKNLANIYVGKPNSFSSCCRMKNDYERIGKQQKEYQNSLGVGGISIGSTRIVGLNLPRIAFEMKRDNTEDFLPYIKKYLTMCHKVLFAHRALLNKHIRAGALPLYSAHWIDLNKQYITYGFIGAYEFLDILGKDITTEDGSNYLVSVLSEIERRSDDWSRKDKISSNIEQIPGESMAVRLAAIDKLLGFNTDYAVDLYSNQYLPLVKEASIYDRFKVQGKMDSLTSGGSILHLNIDDGAELTPSQIRRMIDTAKETGTTYFAVNRVFVNCENDHMSISNNGSCPVCKGKIIDVFTRIVGFIVPVKNWSSARRDKDYPNRVFYSTSENYFSA